MYPSTGFLEKQSQIITPNRNLIIPRLKIRDRLAPPPIARARLEGQHMHWQLRNIHSGRIDAEGEQHNLILTQVGDMLAQYSFQQLPTYGIVSTDSTAPDASDTSIPSEVARTTTVPTGEGSTLTRTADGVYLYTRTVEFSAASVANQNLTKWGFAPTSTEQPISEGLFEDGSQNPVTITPNGSQALRLVYAIQLTLGPVVSTAFTAFSITGWVGTTPVTGQMCLLGTVFTSENNTLYRDLWAFTSMATSYTGTGTFAVDAAPLTGTSAVALGYSQSGSEFAASTPWASHDDYVADSLERTASAAWGTNAFNDQIVGLGVGMFVFGLNDYTVPGLRLAFDSASWGTKDNEHKLTLEGFGWSWTVG